jgi:hypothetical protein
MRNSHARNDEGDGMILRPNATLNDFRGICGHDENYHRRGHGHELYRFAATLRPLLDKVLTRGSTSMAMDVGDADHDKIRALSLLVAFIYSGLPLWLL